MNLKALLSATLLLCLPIFAQAQSKQTKITPLQYNDKLVSITDSLYSLGQQWGETYAKIAGADNDFSKLGEKRKVISAFTTRKIAEVQKGQSVGKGGDELKNAVLDFLAFEKKMIDDAFVPIEKLNASSSQAEKDAAIQKLTKQAEQESAVLKKVNDAQISYGKQNGFEIEAAPTTTE